MKKTTFVLPWWLEIGTETCPTCDHLYLYETEHRCSRCDQAHCSDCAREHEESDVCSEGCDTFEFELEIE